MPQSTISLAILFADISGSTRLYETLGDVAARQKVARCFSVLTAVTHQHGGTVVKTTGDGVMDTFASADSSVQAARAMQEALTKEATFDEHPLAVYVGLHFGPALVEAGDVYGDAVNVAARIASLAKAGQILTTRQTVEVLAPELQAATRHLVRTAIKGKREEIDLYEVIWQEADLTRMKVLSSVPAASQVRLRLRFRDREIELSQGRPVVTIGRGQQNDIAVPDEFTSRAHARIEYRRGRFILLDQSTNGTFVFAADGKAVHLHREELPLQGAGVISLGRILSADSSEVIHFTYEP